jgi:putative nucleotidyltransferase with HDIG domain
MSLLRSLEKPEQYTFNQVASQIEQISSLPHVALKIMDMVNDPDFSTGDLKKIIESDAALSSRILKCVNSSAYALRRKITNLQQAITYLGMRQIRNLAMTACVSDLFKKNENIGSYCRSELWRHLVAVGICARLIAMRLRLAYFEDIFLAGLLHDVGIIMEDQYVHEPFSEMVLALDQTKTLIDNEQQQIGFHHAALGERVGRRWNLPETIIAAIRHHHSSEAYQGGEIDSVRCVEMANFICSTIGVTSVGVQLVRFSPPLMAHLSLSKDDIIVLAEDLKRELEASANLLQM